MIIHPAFGVFAWLAFIFLIAAGVLYLLAFPGLRDRKKAGWDYLFYGVLFYLPYALALLLSPFGDIAYNLPYSYRHYRGVICAVSSTQSL